MNRLSTTTKCFLAACVFLALPAQSLLACAACYGQSDSPLAQGMNWGIFTLLGVLVGVLAGISTFFVMISRRSASVRAVESDETLTRKA